MFSSQVSSIEYLLDSSGNFPFPTPQPGDIMPRYNIEHSVPLSASQQDELAKTITELHINTFPLVPKLFVNVVFEDISHKTTYVAGQNRKTNHIAGRVRHGNRDATDFQKLAKDIEQAWERIVVEKYEAGSRDAVLQTIILSPGNPIGIEGGFPLPLAGEERAWYREHADEFERRAEAGDDLFVELVRDMQERSLR